MLLSLVVVTTLILYRAVNSQLGAPLEPWHTFVPNDAHAAAIDQMDWLGWMAAESRVFDQVKTEVRIDWRIATKHSTTAILRQAPFTPAILYGIGTAPTSSCRTALRGAPSCCCMA